MLWFKKYIECKYHSNGSLVPFKDLAIFAGKLKIMNVSTKKGIFVTNTDYDRRAKEHAKITGIKLINGERLRTLYYRSRGIIPSIIGRKTLNEIIGQYQ